MNIVQTLKGFRDFLPKEAVKRQYVINTLKCVFELYGFAPLETPALEYEEILLGKYGEEGDKLMYRFTDNGKRRVALRYDQTVPLARVVAQYGSQNSPDGKPLLPLPFKRYQIQPVWRAENTQKGRFREFYQCDIDTVGDNSTLCDAEILATVSSAFKKLGFSEIKILVNDRTIFEGLPTSAIITIDKLKKIGEEAVCQELVEKKVCETAEEADQILQNLIEKETPERLKEVLEYAKKLGVLSEELVFSPTLARGLDYYTGLIFEVEIPAYQAGSVCGGGRYDNLVGMFANTQFPAVGCAFGFDRILEAMEQFNLFPEELNTTKVLVTVFSKDLLNQSIELSSRLRSNNISCELYLDENAKMEKQLKYANVKNIPFVIIIGPDETQKDLVTLRNMKTREQIELSVTDLLDTLTK